MNVTITLNKDAFAGMGGIFNEVHAGLLTHIVQRF